MEAFRAGGCFLNSANRKNFAIVFTCTRNVHLWFRLLVASLLCDFTFAVSLFAVSPLRVSLFEVSFLRFRLCVFACAVLF